MMNRFAPTTRKKDATDFSGTWRSRCRETFESLGKKWTIWPASQEDKSTFERLLKLETRLELERSRGYTPAKIHAQDVRQFYADCQSEMYSWGGPQGSVWHTVMFSHAGALLMLQVLLNRTHPNIEKDMVKAIWDDTPEQVLWCYQCVCNAADPSQFSAPGNRPEPMPMTESPAEMSSPTSETSGKAPALSAS